MFLLPSFLHPMFENRNQPGIGGMREAFDLREWVSFAWRHWKFTAAITAIVLVVGAVYLLNQTRLYTASAQVLLDPQKEKMPGGDAMLAESRLNAAVIDSQIAIIRSTVFLRRVVASHLVPAAATAAEPAATSDGNGLFDAVRGFVLGLTVLGEPKRAIGRRPCRSRSAPARTKSGGRAECCRGSQETRSP